MMRRWMLGGLLVLLVIFPVWANAQISVQTAMQSNSNSPDLVIEWLKFRMDPNLRQRYIQTDSRIWTPALASYPGFIDKATWLEGDREGEVVYVIRWASWEQWKAIPEDDLNAIAQRFDAAFGHPYEMVESKAYYPEP